MRCYKPARAPCQTEMRARPGIATHKPHLGIVSTCPGRMRSPEIPFARRRELRPMPCLEAIRPRLSPFLTVYFTTLGLGFTTTGLGFG